MKQCESRHLIFTNKEDITTDFIVRELKKRSLNFVRINTEDIAETRIISSVYEAGTQIIIEGDKMNLSRVSSAYFRRPGVPKISQNQLTASAKAYCIDEWHYILRSIYLEIGDKWFNHPNNIVLAEDKPRQLRIACEIGFNVPETIISNSIDAIRPIFEKGRVIAKPFRHALLEHQDNEEIIFTSEITSSSDLNEEQIKLAPIIFQRKIEKQADIRVTVVGEQVFAASIDSQALPQTSTDWRHSSGEELNHAIFDLEDNTAKLCVDMVKHFGLRFGAIDLILDKNDELWFLECNPNGQWAWIENRTGLPIASAIVDVMETI